MHMKPDSMKMADGTELEVKSSGPDVVLRKHFEQGSPAMMIIDTAACIWLVQKLLSAMETDDQRFDAMEAFCSECGRQIPEYEKGSCSKCHEPYEGMDAQDL